MTTFCAEHQISRKSFYALRARARDEGEAAVLEPKSRRPKTSPARIGEEVKDEAVRVRASLESSGLDHGPISVHDKMNSMGLPAPSIPALARIFRERGVARREPKKKPRSAWRRFVYPNPNACWQLDATEYVLTRGRKCVIFQLIDDHSRYAIASLAASGETSAGAIEVVSKGIAAHGVPQRLLTDNGMALNPSRLGYTGQLVEHVKALGVEPITGKPYKPSTQGKNERWHQTLFRWLDKRALADNLHQLQALVDEFDHIYNTERPHQGLPGRVTPQQAWEATPKAEEPRPRPDNDDDDDDELTTTRPRRRRAQRTDIGERTVRVYTDGKTRVEGVRYQLGTAHAGTEVHALWDTQTISFFDEHGTEIANHPRPAPHITFVGNGRPRGFLANQQTPVTDVLRHQLSPMS
ncbi:MAG TPA: integrase core domain-containing protein [Flexivirga sp.]|nr:integrase core domain-containing protein [Flexivirga sp.]HWC23796.1 integrase core domain-containing protein [Flexivirga sp.]